MGARGGGPAKGGSMEQPEPGNKNISRGQRKTGRDDDLEEDEDLQVTFSKVRKRPKRRVFNCPFCHDSFPKDDGLICHLVAKHSIQINVKAELPKILKGSGADDYQRRPSGNHAESNRQQNNSQEETIPDPTEEVQEPALDEQTPEPSASVDHAPNLVDDGDKEYGSFGNRSSPKLTAKLRRDETRKVLFCGICGVLFISPHQQSNNNNLSDNAFNTKCLSCDEAYQQLSRAEAEHFALKFTGLENHEEIPASPQIELKKKIIEPWLFFHQPKIW